MPRQAILPFSSASWSLPFLGSLSSFLAGTQVTVEIHRKDTTPPRFKLSFGKGTARALNPGRAGRGWEGEGAASLPLQQQGGHEALRELEETLHSSSQGRGCGDWH